MGGAERGLLGRRGTPQTYIDIQLDLIDGVRGTARQGIADSASVADDAHVVHSVVMAGASVGSGAVVRDSIISVGALSPRTPWSMARSSARAVVETGAKLTGLSMLGDGAVAIAGALSTAQIPEVD